MALKDQLVALKDKWVRLRIGLGYGVVRRVKIKEVDGDCLVGVENILLVPRAVLEAEAASAQHSKAEPANTTIIVPLDSIQYVVGWDKDQE
jgi:hypothetical protein